MARRNTSFQQLFFDSLDSAEKSAMGIAENNRREAENKRQATESTARVGLVGEQTRGAKTDADSKVLDYDKTLRKEGAEKAMLGGLDAFSSDPLIADAKLASMTLGRTVTPEELRTTRAREEKGKNLEMEGKEFDLGENKADATRKQEKHASDLAETGRESKRRDAESTSLVGARGAQAEKDRRDATEPPKATELPLDVQSEVRALSGKTAGKKAIANQLESDLAQLRDAMAVDAKGNPIPGKAPNEDLAYSYAQNMLKTMNSKEGADAVGVDEAKRAAGLLEYNIADVKAGLGMKPGKFHGRDIPGFMKQVESNISGIRGSVGANKTEVDQLMGREPAAPAAGGLDQTDPKVKAALAAGYTEDEIRAHLGKGR